MWTSLNGCPYRVYRATRKSICRRCLTLDMQCFPDSEAQKIENSLDCSCLHEWDYYVTFNNSAITDHAKAGWELGLSASGVPCLELCPPDLLILVEELRAATAVYIVEEEKIKALSNGPLRDDIAPDEITFWHNVKMSEGQPFQDAARRKGQAQHAVWNYVENHLRDMQGLPRVGEGWLNEMRLYRIVEKLFPDDEVIHHFRAPWLRRLELDVYVVGANIGFEYQGIQHYEPQEQWGGYEAFERGKERDGEKRHLCATHGTPLIEIRYDEILTEDLVRGKLSGKTDTLKK